MQSIIILYYLSTERGACWRLWRRVTWDVDFLTLRLAMRRTFGKNGCNTTPDGGSFRPMTACLHVWRATPGRSHKKKHTHIWRAESGWRERHKCMNTAPASLCERQINAGYSLTASSSRLCRQIGNREEASKKKNNWEGGGERENYRSRRRPTAEVMKTGPTTRPRTGGTVQCAQTWRRDISRACEISDWVVAQRDGEDQKSNRWKRERGGGGGCVRRLGGELNCQLNSSFPFLSMQTLSPTLTSKISFRLPPHWQQECTRQTVQRRPRDQSCSIEHTVGYVRKRALNVDWKWTKTLDEQKHVSLTHGVQLFK